MNFGEESGWVLHELLQETAWLKTRLVCVDQKTFFSGRLSSKPNVKNTSTLLDLHKSKKIKTISDLCKYRYVKYVSFSAKPFYLSKARTSNLKMSDNNRSLALAFKYSTCEARRCSKTLLSWEKREITSVISRLTFHKTNRRFSWPGVLVMGGTWGIFGWPYFPPFFVCIYRSIHICKLRRVFC